MFNRALASDVAQCVFTKVGAIRLCSLTSPRVIFRHMPFFHKYTAFYMAKTLLARLFMPLAGLSVSVNGLPPFVVDISPDLDWQPEKDEKSDAKVLCK